MFFCLYLTYAVSPLMADRDPLPRNSIAAPQETRSIKLLLVEELLSFCLGSDESDTSRSADLDDDFLIKKRRCLVGGQSLREQILTESHISRPDQLPQADPDLHLHHHEYRALEDEAVPLPSRGYGKLYSGLAPPSLLS